MRTMVAFGKKRAKFQTIVINFNLDAYRDGTWDPRESGEDVPDQDQLDKERIETDLAAR